MCASFDGKAHGNTRGDVLPITAGAVWAIGLKDAGRVLSAVVADTDGLIIFPNDLASYYILSDQVENILMGKFEVSKRLSACDNRTIFGRDMLSHKTFMEHISIHEIILKRYLWLLAYRGKYVDNIRTITDGVRLTSDPGD